MKKTKIESLALMLAIILVFAGCGNVSEPSDEDRSINSSSTIDTTKETSSDVISADESSFFDDSTDYLDSSSGIDSEYSDSSTETVTSSQASTTTSVKESDTSPTTTTKDNSKTTTTKATTAPAPQTTTTAKQSTTKPKTTTTTKQTTTKPATTTKKSTTTTTTTAPKPAPDTKYILNVNIKTTDWVGGGSLACANMLLDYHGTHVTNEELLDNLYYLKLDDSKKTSDGCYILYYPAEEAFIGDPCTQNYGSYAEPIVECMGEYNHNWQYSKSKTDDLCEFLKTEDSPIIVWTTEGMKEKKFVERFFIDTLYFGTYYYDLYNDTFAYLMVGYSDSSVFLVNPYTGKTEEYSKSTFNNAFSGWYAYLYH